MYRFGRIAQLVTLNAVPVAGVVFGRWSNPTALAMYWCETVILVVLMSVRIRVHRVTSRKRGHFVEKRIKTSRAGRTRAGIGHFGTSFFFFSAIMAIFNALFLSWAIGEKAIGTIDTHQLKQGLAVAATLLVLGLLMDLPGIRKRPFAWIKQMSSAILQRVFVMHFIIILGVIGATVTGLPRATLLAFAVMKLLIDITAQLPSLRPKTTETARRRAAAEEQTFHGQPIPFEHALIQRTDG